MIKGQEKICSLIDSLTIDKFPRSLMLVGPSGSGKHLLVEYSAKKLNIPVIDITINLNQEYVEELYNRVEPYMYIIMANELSVKQENAILKFIEEPLKNSFVVLLAETDNGILQTILNRCQIWYLQNYSKNLLAEFVTNDNEYVLAIATTPGQVINLCNSSFEEMLQLADKIIDKIHIASVSNTLTISDKMSFKKESDKFDVKLFTDILLVRIVEKSKTSADNKYYFAYMLTCELKKKLSIKSLDYKALFEGYLINLRSIMIGG